MLVRTFATTFQYILIFQKLEVDFFLQAFSGSPAQLCKINTKKGNPSYIKGVEYFQPSNGPCKRSDSEM